MSDPTADARRAERHDRHLLVNTARRRHDPQGGSLAIGRTLNLSMDGARVVLQDELAEGTELEVTLQLGNRLLEVAARVIYGHPLGDGLHAVGIEFDDLSPAARSLLASYLGDETLPGS